MLRYHVCFCTLSHASHIMSSGYMLLFNMNCTCQLYMSLSLHANALMKYIHGKPNTTHVHGCPHMLVKVNTPPWCGPRHSYNSGFTPLSKFCASSTCPFWTGQLSTVQTLKLLSTYLLSFSFDPFLIFFFTILWCLALLSYARTLLSSHSCTHSSPGVTSVHFLSCTLYMLTHLSRS